MAREFDFVRWLQSRQGGSPLVRVGIGDDLAVLAWPGEELLVVGVDQVLDGVHFDSAVHSPRAIGRKVMSRNLSDCAAMACLPAAALATVALPRGAGLEYAKELYEGLLEAAAPFRVSVVGGDTASWDAPLAVTVTIFGRSGGVAPVTRAGARPGDGVYVTGALGGSILGRHMTFEPRVHLAREIVAGSSGGGVTAMMDLSDGLSRDLAHICRASGVGATIEAARVPIHSDATALAQRDGVSALEHALHDGEDHELLFTCAGTPPAGTRVGRIIEGAELWLEGPDGRRPLRAGGWEHAL